MPRHPRFKQIRLSAWYHVYSRIAGQAADRPLEAPAIQQKFLAILQHYLRAYCCNLSAFAVMGNHYHLVLRFDQHQQLPADELTRRAAILYSGQRGKELLATWSPAQWERFNARLFDLSELLRNLQSAFARWYNDTFERRGRFWADRFKSVFLEDLRAVKDCMLYVDLNPVRAGLVQRPEDYAACSYHLRALGGQADRWLLPLQQVYGRSPSDKQSMTDYRARLMYRGNVPTKAGQAAIPAAILENEKSLGFAHPGMFRQRLKYFIDGIAIGSEDYIRRQIERLRDAGQYLRRKNPIQTELPGQFALKAIRPAAG